MKRFFAATILLAMAVIGLILPMPGAAAGQEAAAIAFVEANKDAIIKDWVELVKIPGKSAQEQARTAWVEAKFREAGLADVKVDAVGNVSGFLAGAPGAPTVMIAAHMDTVFDNSTSLTPKFEGGKMHVPAAGDNTPSVVGLVWLAKAIKAAGTPASVNLLLVATVQEEIGLKGMSYYMDHMQSKPDMVISVDGGVGAVTAGALGIKWIKAIFTTAAGHTLSSTGKPSATKSLAAGITAAYQYQADQTPKIYMNCGVIGGGTVPNAISGEAWTTIDMRSQDAAELQKLFDNVTGAMAKAAKDTGAEFKYEWMNDLPAGVMPGAADHKLTTTAVAVLKELGFNPTVGYAGATDANVAISKGVNTISIGMVKAGNGHSESEWAEVDSIVTGMKQLVMIVSRL